MRTMIVSCSPDGENIASWNASSSACLLLTLRPAWISAMHSSENLSPNACLISITQVDVDGYLLRLSCNIREGLSQLSLVFLERQGLACLGLMTPRLLTISYIAFNFCEESARVRRLMRYEFFLSFNQLCCVNRDHVRSSEGSSSISFAKVGMAVYVRIL